ncbi:V-type ATP synthase subunit F [Nanohaloarchaea archaeon]|nr:V-type ATP synthase subunit F [Candidatus Nanohaloarchaea archaeon]
MSKEHDEKSIAVIGGSDLRLGFKLAGVQKTFEKENYEQKIQDLIDREDIGILITEKKDLNLLSKRIRKNVESSVNPVVVSLSEDAESERLQEKIKKAIGADITG